jgi:hypothetical protein
VWFKIPPTKYVPGDSKKTTTPSPESVPREVQSLDSKQHIEPSNNKKTTADIAAVLFTNKNQLAKADLLIENTLTATQKELVHKALTPLCIASDLNPSQTIAEAEYALLEF